MVKTSILLKIEGYGLQTEGYRYIKSAKVNLETSYLSASDLESVTRSVTKLSASAITISNLTCTTQTKSTSCKGDLAFTPDELGLTQSEISTHQVEDLNIRPVPRFFDESGVEIANLAFNGQTQPYSSTLSNQMARKATYNVLPNPDLPETRHCAEIYSTGTSIGFTQRSLARTVAGKFNDMGTSGFQIACNDAGLPFGGFLYKSAACRKNDLTIYPTCHHESFPHRGPEHRKARAIDIRYFSKDRDRRERLDLTGGKNKKLVMSQLYNYVEALLAQSDYCAGKMTAVLPNPSEQDPMGLCQDSTGARRFTGQECMINRERIHAAKLMAEPPPTTYWTWDAAVNSTLAKSRIPYIPCPVDEAYTYSVNSTTYQSIDDAINYAADFRDGVLALFTNPIRKTKLKFTFGTQGDLTTGLTHDEWNSSMLNNTYSVPTVPANITIYRQGVEFRSNLPAINKKTLDGHLDHLHLEVEYDD